MRYMASDMYIYVASHLYNFTWADMARLYEAQKFW